VLMLTPIKSGGIAAYVKSDSNTKCYCLLFIYTPIRLIRVSSMEFTVVMNRAAAA
jgi:hypothetical protein